MRWLRRMSGYSKDLKLRMLATVDRRGMLGKEGIVVMLRGLGFSNKVGVVETVAFLWRQG